MILDSRKGWKMRTGLDLAFDIDDTVGSCFGLIEQRACFARQQPYSPVPLLQQFFGGVVENKTGGLLVGLESKLFCDKSNVDIWFVSTIKRSARMPRQNRGKERDLRSTHCCKSTQPLTIDKHVHKVGSHIRRIKVQLEETMVVPECKGRADIQGMLHGRVFLIFCSHVG